VLFRSTPEDPLAPFRLGRIQQRAGHHSVARDWYQEALRANAYFTPARLALALIYSRVEGKPEVAERHLRQILGRYRLHARQEEVWSATRELVRILLRSKREAEARELAKTLPVLIADTPDLAISQARALASGADGREALTPLETYLGSHPNEPEALLLLAQLLERQGKEEETVRTYRATLTLRPQWPPPYVLLIRFLIARNRDDDALDVANALLSRAALENDKELALPLDGETDPPDWKALFPSFKLLAKRHPDSAIASALVGLAHLETGQLQPALKAFDRARAVAGSLEFPNIYVARIFLALKNPAGAIPPLKEALGIHPTSSTSHYWLGVALARNKRRVEAEEALKIVIGDETWGSRAMNALGDIALAREERAKAEEWWKRSLAREPRSIPPWDSLLRPASN
jgi:tetratricopeptide (TPR) repeat protein